MTKRSENVRLLLEHGADLDGALRETQLFNAGLLRRFTTIPYMRGPELCNPPTAEDVGSVSPEFIPLTEDELLRRREEGRVSTFWAEPRKTRIEVPLENGLLNSVVQAGASTAAILDQVIDSGADISQWQGSVANELLSEEDELSPSALGISTPFHSAIAVDDMEMLQILVERFDVKSRAMVSGSLALTPVQYAVAIGRMEAFRILRAHRDADLNLLTPVFGVHLLQFAVATLRTEILDALADDVPVSKVPATALGHSLLHVACLPYKKQEVQASPKIVESIHDTRNMRWTHFRLPVPDHHRSQQFRDLDHETSRQAVICKKIVEELGPEELQKPDFCGNTPLHYLASGRFSDEELIVWMRRKDGGEEVWMTASNRWGHTPRDLWEENEMWAEKIKAPCSPASQARTVRRRDVPRGSLRARELKGTW